ncbi:MAG TPA: fumarylacetoacetate hydrolase family protein [Bryobacteraceae bacterium]|nr:fumarylacetoacetate hydrolase family protein [Bryobacteraceae bacterium]
MTPTAAQLLAEARAKHARLAELPESVRPQNTEEAYECQAELMANLLAHYGGEPAGYKIACTNAIAQRQLGVGGPFYGTLATAHCFESPARLDASQFFMRVVEAEFGFRMGRDLPPPIAGNKAAHSRQEIAEAVEGVIPSIEIVDSRFDDWLAIGALSLIADNACHAAWVRGPLVKNWRSFDLAGQPVRVYVNGKLAREGSGAAVLGHPLNALEWLVNALAERGIGLKRGQYVTTGVTTEVYMAERGDRAVADFGGIGRAEVEFV